MARKVEDDLLTQVRKAGGEIQQQARDTTLPNMLAVLRRNKEADPVAMRLLELYEKAHPTGKGTPAAAPRLDGVLVEGDPPLTRQDVVERAHVFLTWILDTPVTDEEFEEFQRIYAAEWKKMNRDTRRQELERVAVWLKYLDKETPARRRLEGVHQQAETLPRLRKLDEPDIRWMLERYDAAHKVGGSRNYVLVPGNPQLTQGMVEGLSNYVDCTGGQWLVYGMTAAQRQQFRDLVMTDWTAGGAGRNALIADLKTWEAASKLPKAEQDKFISRTRCQYYIYLKTAPGDHGAAGRNWMASVVKRMREQFDFQMQVQNLRHATLMTTAKWDLGSTVFEQQKVWNNFEGKYEMRWVERPRK